MGAKGIVDLAGRRRSTGRGGASDGLLERVAFALNSTLEINGVLRRLAEITLDYTGAQRCSVFLSEDRRLYPAIAIGTWSDEDLWSAFRSMAPTELDMSRWQLLEKGIPIVLEDAGESDLIPPEWVDRFSLHGLALVPLTVAGEPLGLMAVDWPSRHSFEEKEVRTLEAIGSYAGLAVRNARLFETVRRRARLQEALARGAAALSSTLEPVEIARRLVDAYSELIGAEICAIGLFDTAHTQVTTIASQGARCVPGPLRIADIPAHIVTRLVEEWSENKGSVIFESEPWFGELVAVADEGSSYWYLVLPLVTEDRVRGAVLLGFDRGKRLAAEEQLAAEALASIAAVAVGRNAMVERLNRHLRHLDAVYKLSTALHGSTGAPDLVARLNELLSGYGIEVAAVAFRNRELARRFGGEKITASERPALLKGAELLHLPDGSMSVPMRLNGRVVGLLRVRKGEMDIEERLFLEALAGGVAEVASMDAARAALEDASREQALATERDRIASDLHDTAGQLFVAIGLLGRRLTQHLPKESPWADKILRLVELADRGKWEIDQAIRALAFFPAARRGLVASLTDLGRSFQADSGVHILVKVIGKPVRLGADVERALYRVSHEALSNAWRHSRCSLVRMELIFSAGEVALHIRDDGVGLKSRGNTDTGTGILSMRRTLAEVNGSLRVRNASPRGLLVQARVPKER